MVRSGIEQGLLNDISDFSAKPEVTDAAKRRIAQFTRWLIRIFDVWYVDVTEASDKATRKCLTDKFPHDSPGNLDKESVFKANFCELLAL